MGSRGAAALAAADTFGSVRRGPAPGRAWPRPRERGLSATPAATSRAQGAGAAAGTAAVGRAHAAPGAVAAEAVLGHPGRSDLEPERCLDWPLGLGGFGLGAGAGGSPWRDRCGDRMWIGWWVYFCRRTFF